MRLLGVTIWLVKVTVNDFRPDFSCLAADQRGYTTSLKRLNDLHNTRPIR